jgi:hypothetical protein
MGTQPSLGDFERSLVLPNFEKLSDTLLVRSKSYHFTDQFPHEGRSLSKLLKTGHNKLSAFKQQKRSLKNDGAEGKALRSFLCIG